MTALGPIALDGEEVPAPANGDDWRIEWHPPPSAPPGPWRPQHEIPFRRTIPASDLAGRLRIEPGAGPIYARAVREADLTLPATAQARPLPGRAG